MNRMSFVTAASGYEDCADRPPRSGATNTNSFSPRAPCGLMPCTILSRSVSHNPAKKTFSRHAPIRATPPLHCPTIPSPPFSPFPPRYPVTCASVDATSSTVPSVEASAGSFDASSVQFPPGGAYGSGAPDGQGEASAMAALGVEGSSLEELRSAFAPGEGPGGEKYSFYKCSFRCCWVVACRAVFFGRCAVVRSGAGAGGASNLECCCSLSRALKNESLVLYVFAGRGFSC